MKQVCVPLSSVLYAYIFRLSFRLRSLIPFILILPRMHLLYTTIFFASLVHYGLVHAACIPNITADAQGFAETWVKEPDGRGTWTIVYSTSLSLFLCAWTSLHLNIPRTDETWREMIWRFVKWGLLSFLVPEFVIFIALLQWYRAKGFRTKLNAILAHHEKECREKGDSLEGKDFTPFTMLYAWFALMGGFSIDTSRLHNTLSVATLGLDGVLFLARRGHFLRLSDAQISDKSKADYLAKGLVCFQVSWFVGQGVTRKIAGLPITLLEFHAFVNIGCALLTYSLWFTKPLAIKTPYIKNPASIEQLVAVMLFNAELDEKPKFYLEIWEAPRSRPPAEKWLWCWVPNKPTLSVNPHIPEHIFEKIPERNVQIKPAGQEKITVCFRGRDIVSTLDEPRCYLACGCPWSDRDGLHRTNTTLPTFNVHLSKKDEKRLDLVRLYIEAEYGIRPSVTIVTPEASPTRKRLPPTPSPSPTRECQATSTSLRPISNLSNPSSYATSNSDMEVQDNDINRGRPTTLPANFRTHEYLASMTDSRRQGMPVHRIWCLNEVPNNCIYSILPNFDTSDVLDYGFTRLSKWRWWLTVTALLIVPSGYGALHIIPIVTHFSFPTHSEKHMWWISCIFIMSLVAGPLAFASLKSLLAWISEGTSYNPNTRRGRKREKKKQRLLRRILYGIATMYFIVWITARGYLMVESFISLRREKAEIFQTPQWNWLNYIPHI